MITSKNNAMEITPVKVYRKPDGTVEKIVGTTPLGKATLTDTPKEPEAVAEIKSVDSEGVVQIEFTDADGNKTISHYTPPIELAPPIEDLEEIKQRFLLTALENSKALEIKKKPEGGLNNV